MQYEKKRKIYFSKMTFSGRNKLHYNCIYHSCIWWFTAKTKEEQIASLYEIAFFIACVLNNVLFFNAKLEQIHMCVWQVMVSKKCVCIKICFSFFYFFLHYDYRVSNVSINFLHERNWNCIYEYQAHMCFMMHIQD